MPPFDPLYLSGLFAIALVAGTIDAMAGGGGLLTLPALLPTGIAPLSALATNKAQAIFSSFGATLHFARKGRIDFRALRRPALMSCLGAAAGAASVSVLDPGMLKVLVPFLLIGICVWLAFNPRAVEAAHPRISHAAAGMTLVPLVGFYDGFLGPGTGTFFALGLVALAGLKLDEATIEAKLFNFMSNLGALVFFLFAGRIVWLYAAVMAVGMMAGGQIGARLVLRHGVKLIRPLLIATSLAMSVRLLWQNGTLQQVWNAVAAG